MSEPNSERLITPMPTSLVEKIDDHRFRERMLSRADAIRRFVLQSLSAAAPVTSIAEATSTPQLASSPRSAPIAPEVQTQSFEFPDELTATVEAYQANHPWLDSYDKAVTELVERGLEALNPPENVITFEDGHLAPIRRLAGERPLKQVVLELPDYAVRGYNARQEEIEDGA